MQFLLVNTDNGFSIPSPHAMHAQSCADKLLESMSENPSLLTAFATMLISRLEENFVALNSTRASRENIWENYYKLHSSEEYKMMWIKFLWWQHSLCSQPYNKFHYGGNDQATLNSNSSSQPVSSPLDYFEANALRYTAGYVIRALQKKCTRQAHLLKEELVLCLTEMEAIGIILWVCIQIAILCILYG